MAAAAESMPLAQLSGEAHLALVERPSVCGSSGARSRWLIEAIGEFKCNLLDLTCYFIYLKSISYFFFLYLLKTWLDTKLYSYS